MDAMQSETWHATPQLEDRTGHNVLLLLVDLVILSLALWLALGLHPHVPMDRLSELDLWGWSRWFLLLWAIWIPVASAIEVYELRVAGDANRVLALTALALLVAGPVHILVPFISVPLINPLWTWFVFMGAAALGLITWRAAYAVLWAPVPLQRITLVGRRRAIEPLVQALGSISEVQVVDVLSIDARANGPFAGGSFVSQIRRLGLPHNGRQDTIVIDPQLCQEPEVARLVSQWSEAGLSISSIASCYETWLGQMPIEHLDVSAWIGHVQERELVLRAWDAVCRVGDLLCALLGLPFWGVALILVGLTRRGDTEAPIILSTPCVGRQGKPFGLLRFYEAAPAWLRDLPMLWNLLMGRITLIGPRPLLQTALPSDPALAGLVQLRAITRPGLIGWAQVRDASASASDHDPVADLPYDLYYIKNRGPSRDIAVLYHLFRGTLASLAPARTVGST